MATAERFSGYPARFGYSTAQTMDIVQMMGAELDAGNTKTDVIPSGAVDRLAVLTPRQDPEFRIRTRDLATTLATVGLQTGRCFDEASTFFYQERADCSTFEVGFTHPARRTQKGFMFPDSITAEQDDEEGAVLSLMYRPLKSGSSPLVEHLADQPLTGVGAPAYVSAFFLGPVYHNSAELLGVTGWTLTLNSEVQTAPRSPGGEPDFASITRRTPEISIRCPKVDNFDTFKLAGTPVNTSWAVYLQRADPTNGQGDGRIAPATASHIKISGTSGDWDTRNLGVEGQDDALMDVVLRPTGALTVSIASSIP